MVPDPVFPTLGNEVYYNGNSYGRFIWGEAETPPPPEDRASFELGAFGYIGLNIEPSIIVGGAPFGFRLYDIRFGARYNLALVEPALGWRVPLESQCGQPTAEGDGCRLPQLDIWQL